MKDEMKTAIDTVLSGVKRSPALEENVLSRIHQKSPRRVSFSLVLSAVLSLLLLGTALAAVFNPGILSFLFHQYGQSLTQKGQNLIENVAIPSLTLNGCTVTLTEAVTDGYVGMAILRFEAPEGTYLYSDLCDNEIPEGKNVLSLMDGNILLTINEENMPPESEYAMDAQRQSDNVLIAQFTWTVGGKNASQVILDVGIKQGDVRETGTLSLPISCDTDAYPSFTMVQNPSDTSCGLARLTVVFTPLMTRVEATFTDDSDYYELLVTDENGTDLPFTYLSSFGYELRNGFFAQGYGEMETLPAKLYVQVLDRDGLPVTDVLELKMEK